MAQPLDGPVVLDYFEVYKNQQPGSVIKDEPSAAFIQREKRYNQLDNEYMKAMNAISGGPAVDP